MLNPNKIKIVIIYKNFFSIHDFFYEISSSLWLIERSRSRSRNSYFRLRLQEAIKISAPRLQLRLRNTGSKVTWNGPRGDALHEQPLLVLIQLLQILHN